MPNGQYPVFSAGQILTAALLQSATPLNAYKTGDTSRTTTTTLANDPDLSVAVAANAFYFWAMMLDFEGGTQGSSDLKFEIVIPSGAARFWMGNGSTAGVSTSSFMGNNGTAYSAGTSGAGNLHGLLAVGTCFTAGTGGSFTLQWAQNTSNGVATIVHAGSALLMWRMA